MNKIKNTMDNNRLNLNQLEIGKPLTPWALESIFGEEIPTIESYIGKPLLILIFGLGCPGCLGRAIPYANRIVFEKGGEMEVIGIHTNFEGLDFTKEKFAEAKTEFLIRFPFYKDKNYDTTFLNYGAGGTPHWILIDENGDVVYSIFGSDPNNALLRLDLRINEILVPRKA
ncbi:MAG: thiol-disulfide isomerase/thioredoxin [Saprospiraceae bacterium]|jgi:thiol-disulfide isomerase/thioredoxin|tara:strand:- start:145 stop:657 length:513 start_codon:yes stop_codon:yes gene_type:complete